MEPDRVAGMEFELGQGHGFLRFVDYALFPSRRHGSAGDHRASLSCTPPATPESDGSGM
jgi:hypothetical protein